MAEGHHPEEVNSFTSKNSCCVICKQGFEDENPAVTVSKKGMLTLITFGEKHGRVDLCTYEMSVLGQHLFPLL